MARDMDFDDEDDEEREAPPRRSSPPRYGPFLTIAVAILMLFGAASRFGKSETGSWLNLDFLASRSIEQDRLRLQEQRNLTLVTLGAVPTRAPDPGPGPDLAMAAPLQNRAVLPPSRGEFDLETFEVEQRERQRREQGGIQLSMPVQTSPTAGSGFDPDPASHFDPVPEAQPSVSAGTVYVVREGDNWVKIGKATGKKWQEIQNANSTSKNGLRVGMKLVIL
ncbi:MAG: LysM peptidoglycan-binding domain-containing protein [Planctomycetaceae bacterium]|nr:LysM peptidoglycan-binding domain-containing protein [Planctomycetaceae bacterium]